MVAITGRPSRRCKAQAATGCGILLRAAGGAAVRYRDCRGRRWKPAGRAICARLALAAVRERRGQRPLVAAGQADQSRGKFFEIFECGRAFGLGGLAHLEARDELAKILIAGLRCAEQQHARRLLRVLMRQPCGRREPVAEGRNGNLRADVRLDSACASPRCESAPRHRGHCGRPAPWRACPSSAARSISASGCDAPSRKLKALAACSSTYSLVISHKTPPAATRSVPGHATSRQATERTVAPRRQHIPLFRVPFVGGPPAAAGSPRPVGGRDLKAVLLDRERQRLHRTLQINANGHTAAACAATAMRGASGPISEAGTARPSPRRPQKPSMRKLPARCVSSSTGEPTRSSPTIAFNRASVTSSREGSGVCGANSPSCTLLDWPASAVSVSATTAACGGCAPISSCSSLSRNLRSVEGSAGRIVPCERRLPSSFMRTVSEASDERTTCRARNQAVDHARADKEQRIHLLHRRFELAELFE